MKFFIAISIFGFGILRAMAETPVYAAQTSDSYLNLKILRKPGNCASHEDFPNTIQCAETNRCIAFRLFNNSVCDCCGPEKNCDTCSDHSDENRVSPPGGDVCKNHPHYQYGLCYQCATKRNICLSRLLHWNNGQCDCCPEQNFVCGHPNCTDHSDEECPANEWSKKFSCDGNCIAIEKLNDTETDCYEDCYVETNPTARANCEKRKTESLATSATQFCTQMAEKNTPYFQCTSGHKPCIPTNFVRDGIKHCPNGEDEDAALHPKCTSQIQRDKCDPAVMECIFVNKNEDLPDCRCGTATNGIFENCNKDRPNKRRRLY